MSDGPDRELSSGYSIEVVGAGAAAPDDVLPFWQREQAVAPEEANRRLHQVLLVARAPGGEVAGVSTAYLQRNAQLRLDLWYQRAYVGRDHRLGNVAALLAWEGLQALEGRWLDGSDRRGVGILYEVENEAVKQHFPEAVWMPGEVTFIGVTAKGAHVRVRFFPGALAA